MFSRQSRVKTMTLNPLFILLMFLASCGAELCEPVSKSKCCDPEVCFSKIFLFKSNVWPDPDFWSVPPFSLLLQDLGNRYTLNSIYKDESQCPAVQYKCRRGGRGRPLVWQRQDSDTFKGIDDSTTKSMLSPQKVVRFVRLNDMMTWCFCYRVSGSSPVM